MKRLLHITRIQLIAVLFFLSLSLAYLFQSPLSHFIPLEHEMLIFLLFLAFLFVGLLTWCATIVYSSNDKNKGFTIALTLSIGLFCIIPLLTPTLGIIGNNNGPTAVFITPSSLLKVLPWILAETSCLLYCFFSVDRIIKQNTKETGTFDDNGSRIIALLLFFPLGMWMTQPKVNEIFKDK